MDLPDSIPPLPDRTTIKLRPGVNRQLEDAATEMLRVSLAGVTRHSDKSDILTPWKQQHRLSREVYNRTGVADNGRVGMYHRALNRAYPHLNSRDGTFPARKGCDRLAAHVEEDSEHGGLSFDPWESFQ